MRFGHQIVQTYLVRLLLIPLGVLTAVITARWLGPTGKGVFTAISTYLAIAGIFAGLGLAVEATRQSAQDGRRTGALLANARLTAAISGLLTLGILLGLHRALGRDAFDQIPAGLLLVAALGLPASLAGSQFQAVLLGRQQVSEYNATEALDRLGLFAAALVLLVFLGLDVTALVVATTGVALAKLLACEILLWPESSRWRPDLALLRSMSRVSSRAYVTCLLSFLVLRSDIVLINGILGAERTGVYSVAVQLSGLLLMLPAAVGTLLFGRVAAASGAESAAFTALVSRHLALVISVACAGLALAGGWLVRRLFGPGFEDAAGALLILLPGVWCMALQGILSNDLSGRDYPRVLPIVWGLALALNVLLNLWWLPVYGIAGAAASSTVAYVLSFLVITGYWLRRFPQISSRQLLLVTAAELRRIPERLRQVLRGGERARHAT